MRGGSSNGLIRLLALVVEDRGIYCKLREQLSALLNFCRPFTVSCCLQTGGAVRARAFIAANVRSGCVHALGKLIRGEEAFLWQ